MFDRRVMLGGLGAALASGHGAWAAKKPPPPDEQPLFVDGPAASNPIAQMFTIPRKTLVWPKCRLIGADGKMARLEDLKGKLLLVDLWAEWCTPCLAELPGVAWHRSHNKTDRFEIVPICTGSHAFASTREMPTFLAKIGAKDLGSWLDISGEGRELTDTVAINPKSKDGDGAVPCMLIIDKDWNIRGHALGGFDVTVEAGPDKGKQNNAWNTTLGQDFVKLLVGGELPLA
jgi:thiol-disulfide isomerase/thioredoxin